MKKHVLSLLCIYLLTPIIGHSETFRAHCRDYPPELYFDGQKCVGPVPDLMTDILKELGHNIVWSKKPWVRSYKESKTGDADLMIRHSMVKEREYVLQATPYGYVTRKLHFYRSPFFKQAINNYEDIKKHNIGAIRGVFYSPSFTLLDTNVLTEVASTDQLISMLERGRIDLVVTSPTHSEELFKGRFEKVEFVDTFDNPMFISIPKKSPNIKFYPEIARLLFEYRKQGKVDEYFEKYNLPPPKQLFE